MMDSERGDLGIPVSLHVFDRGGRAGMQALPARTAEASVQRLADEGVREPVGRTGRRIALHDQLRPKRLFQGGDQRVLFALRHRAQDVEAELPSQHRGLGQGAAAPVRETCETPPEYLIDTLGDADLVRRQRGRPASSALEQHPGLDQVAHHLLDEEGVALRVLVNRAYQAGGRLVPGVRGDQRSDAAFVQAVERDPLEEPVATQVREQRPKRVFGVDLRLAIGGHDQQRCCVRRPDHVSHQFERGLVRPVQVFQYEHERGARGRLREQRRDRLEHQVAARLEIAWRDRRFAGGRRGELRDQSRQLAGARAQREAVLVQLDVAGVVPQRLDERLVRDQRLLMAPRVEHGALIVRRARELADQARLADPGLARHQDQPAAARTRLLPGRPQDVELRLTSNERRALGGRKQRGQRDARRGTACGRRLVRRGAGFAGEQPAVQLLHLRRRRGAQLLAQQHAQLVVHPQRLGDVPCTAKRLHQEAVTGLAERRAGDQLPARALGRAEPGSTLSEPAARQPLERLELELLELPPARVEPVAVLIRQKARPQQLERRLRLLARDCPLPAGRGVRAAFTARTASSTSSHTGSGNVSRRRSLPSSVAGPSTRRRRERTGRRAAGASLGGRSGQSTAISSSR
jgi:hypothetical protein